MPAVDLPTLESTSRQLMQLASRRDPGRPSRGLEDMPLLAVADSGQLQVLEPFCPELHGRWTRFKAALVGLPLVGWLDTVRKARAALDEARAALDEHDRLYEQACALRGPFEQQLQAYFGAEIREQALRRATDPKVLTARSVAQVLSEAERLSISCADQNAQHLRAEALQEKQRPGDDWVPLVRAYADALATASPGFFTKPFASGDLKPFLERACQVVFDIERLLSSDDAPALREYLKQTASDYAEKIRPASPRERTDIARRFLIHIGSFHDIVWCRPTKRRAHPDDVRLVHLLGAGQGLSRLESAMARTDVADAAWQQLADWHRQLGEERTQLAGEPSNDSGEGPAQWLRRVAWGATPASASELWHAARREMLRAIPDRSWKQHEAAWREVLESQSLTGPQQDLLLERLPQLVPPLEWPDQKRMQQHVRQYARIARMIAECLPQIEQAGKASDPVAIFDIMARIERALQSGMRGLRDAPQDVAQLARPLEGDELERCVFELCVDLALAKSPSAADPGEGSGSRQGEQCRDELAPAGIDAVSQFRQLCSTSPSPDARKLASLYDTLAHRPSGLSAASSRPPDPASDAERPSAVERPPYRAAGPELLARTLLGPGGHAEIRPGGDPDNPARLDRRGVREGSAAERHVSKTFALEAVVKELQPVPRGQDKPLEDMLADTLTGDPALKSDLRAHGADIVINGRRLAAEPDATAAFKREIEAEPDGERLARAIGGCLSGGWLDEFCAAVDRAAFDPPLPLAHQRSVHEVWKNDDGSWTVRSTHAAHPLGQGRREGFTQHSPHALTAPIPFDPEGVVLYSITHLIPPAQDGDIRVHPPTYHTVFAF